MKDSVQVVIVGKDRTMMTIECIKNIVRYLKGIDYGIIVGSDRSANGHIQAVNSYLKTLNIPYRILDCATLGGTLNKCLDEAFLYSNYALCIENDMILHKDLFLANYINVLRNTNAGNVQFRCFSPETHNCGCGIMEYERKTYIYTFPYQDRPDGGPVSFGQNLFSKKFYHKLGHFLEAEDTSKTESDFMKKYSKQFNDGGAPLLNILDCESLHKIMNDERGYFYHIGILSQHANVRWNANVIPSYYHYLSDDRLDSAFRTLFI